MINRRVPQIIGIYLAASWGILQFVDWCVNRYILSPNLVDFTLTTILSLIPSILILAYFHGAPGKDGWTKIEKIGIPVNILASIVVLFMFFSAEDLGAATETVIIENEDGQQIERVIPKADFIKNIALFPLENKITDPELTWVGYGIMGGLNCDISQEMFINSNEHVYPKLQEKGFYGKNSVPLALKREIAKELHVEYFFGGHVDQDERGDFIVNTSLYRTRDGKVLASNDFQGDDIFLIIDKISLQTKYDMEIPTGYIENSIDLPIAEITTTSMIAFENWVRGIYEFMGNNYDAGISYLEKAVEEDPTFAMAYFSLQGFYVMTNNGDKRLETIKKAMEHIYKIPERFQYIVKVVYFDSKKEPDKVFKGVRMHLELFPYDITAYEIMAQIYMGRGEIENVIDQLKTIINIDPTRHEYLLKIGQISYHHFSDKDEAFKYYNKYLAIYPDNIEVHGLIGEIYKDDGDIEAAKETYEKVLIIDPENIDAFISIIEMDYEGLEQIDETYKALTLCKNAEDSVSIYRRVEDELEQHGRFAESMENWEIYRKLLPSFEPFLHYAIRQLFYPVNYIKINQNEKAFAIMDEFQSTYKDPFDAFLHLGYLSIYLELEDAEKSSYHLEKSIEAANSMGAQLLIDMIKVGEAKTYRLNGQYDKAIQTLLDSPRVEDPDHKYELARCYRLKKQYTKAMDLLDACSGSESMFELGILNYEMNDVEQAKENLKQFIDYFRDGDPELIKVNKAKEYLIQWASQS